MDMTDPNNLTNVLKMLSANNTETVRQGEKILKPFAKKPDSIIHLLQQLRGCPDATVRHHAALLMKKKIGVHYSKFNGQNQSELKTQILGVMLSEPEKPVAVAIAGAASLLAKSVFARNEAWPEMFQMLVTLSQDPNERLRTLNFSFMGQLAEHAAEHMKQHTNTLAQMFTHGCQDTVISVATAALTACSSYIVALGSAQEVMILQVVIPPMLQVMVKCLHNGEEEVVVEALDVIQECCELEQPLVNEHIEGIVEFVMGIIRSNDCDSSVKQAAGQTIINIIENRPKLFAKKQLVGPVLAALMEMIAAQDASAAGAIFSYNGPNLAEDNDDEDFSPEMDIQKLAQTIIDYMAIEIPSKYFVDTALNLCSQGLGSPDSRMRKAACAVLGIIAEGCSDKIRELLSTLLPTLLQSVQDPEHYVRECACFALGQFSEFCQPEILQYTSTVLPVVFQALDDSRPTVQGTSCYVLETFCENLQPDVLRPYLGPLMNKLAALLHNAQDKTTKEMSLSAIAATAVAAEIDFLPYAENLCEVLAPMLFYTEPSLFALRGRALECLGHVAVAIESTHFARYFETGMKSATQGLALNDESLKEHSFVFIANSAKVMGRAFEMYLGEMVPYLIGVLSESELSVMENVDDEEDDEEYDENADEESDNRRIQLNVQEGFINSKKAALTAIGALAEHTKELFFPYLEKTYEILVAEGIGAIYSLHGLIRAEAYSIMQHIVSLLCISAGIISKPAYGEVVPMNETMSSVTKEIMNCYVECLCMDEDKYPVANACEGLIGVLDKLGVAALQLPNRDNSGPVINELLTSIKLLLNEKAACQKDSQYDAGDEDNEDEDHDYVMMDSLTDLIAALARLLRADYVPCFDEFLKPLMKFTKPTRSSSDRAMAIGCFAEVVAELGPATLKYVDMIVPILKSQLNDGIESVRRNSAFCVGMLVKSTGNSLAPQFMAMLQMLQPLCVRRNIHGGTESTGADVDNALSAVAYMITASRDSIPLAQVLPVMVGALPLTGDTSEGPNIYGCLSNLVLTNNEVALSILPQIVSAMGDCLVPGSSAVDETKAIAQGCIQQMVLSPQLQPLLMNSLSTISNEASRNCLQQLLSAQ